MSGNKTTPPVVFRENEGYTKGKEGYRKIFDESEQTGECLFCQPQLGTNNTITHETGLLWIVDCKWHYKDAATKTVETTHHWLLIPKRHVAPDAGVLTNDEWLAMRDALEWLKVMRDVQRGALCMRFGEARLNGSTIFHLHAHVIQPGIYPDGEKVGEVAYVGFPIG